MGQLKFARLALLCAALAACSSDAPAPTTDLGVDIDGAVGDGGSPDGGSMSGIFPVDFNDPTATFRAQLRIVDLDGRPVVGAVARVGSRSAMSNAEGLIDLADVLVSTRQSAAITATGYMPTHAALSYASAGQRELRVALTPARQVVSFEASDGVTTGADGASVHFEPSALLNPDGTPYSGEVVLAFAVVDPTQNFFKSIVDSNSVELADNFDEASLPEGAMFAEGLDGVVTISPPESVVQVELSKPDGTPLSVDTSVGAAVSIPLPSITLKTLGDILPLMSLDAALGRWVPNGQCTVERSPTDPTALVCNGNVRHFSPVGIAARPAFTSGCVDYRGTTNFPEGAVVNDSWVEESVVAPGALGFRPVRSREAQLYAAGMCNINQLRWSRFVMKVTSGDDTRFFSTDWELTSPLALTGRQIDVLRANAAETCSTTCTAKTFDFSFDSGTVGDDADGDGYFTQASAMMAADCDDTDARVYPGAPEAVCATRDFNCDSMMPATTTTTWNSAGMTASSWNNTYCRQATAGACAMTATEIAGNAFDENCDGIVSDADGDTFFAANDPAYAAAVTTNPGLKADCDDQNANASPGGREIAGNIVDENCDGLVVDRDGDGYLSPAHSGLMTYDIDGLRALPSGADRFSDCNDGSPLAYPGASIAPERVLEGAYKWSPTALSMESGICAGFTDGMINATGRAQLFDANCDGTYSDLDGDGYTVPGDNSLGADKAIDCNDADPRLNTQAGCTLSTAENVCTTRPLINGSLMVIDSDGDGVPDMRDICPGHDDRIDGDSDGTPDGCDACPIDGDKTAAGLCGCGIADTDGDSDGTPDCNDACPSDPAKIDVGLCGCGVAEGSCTVDLCPTDPEKTEPGICGCGVPEGTCDGDLCPLDPEKTEPGICGCGVPDTSDDSDEDGTIDCLDECFFDPDKVDGGICGCFGPPDTDPTATVDTDEDGVADCADFCPENADWGLSIGLCGCDVPPGEDDLDSDSDGYIDCSDSCPFDPLKSGYGFMETNICGCGNPEGSASVMDSDFDGVVDCLDVCPGADDSFDLRTYYLDSDMDSYGDPTQSRQFCSSSDAWDAGYITSDYGFDCNDADPQINPNAFVLSCTPDGVDNNCNDEIDEEGEQFCSEPPLPEGCAHFTSSSSGRSFVVCSRAGTLWTGDEYLGGMACPEGYAPAYPLNSDEDGDFVAWVNIQRSAVGQGNALVYIDGRLISSVWRDRAGDPISYLNFPGGPPASGECRVIDQLSGKHSPSPCGMGRANIVCEAAL